MSILTLLLVFVVVGVVLWLINAYIPMEPNIKKMMNIAVVIIMAIWLITTLFPGLSSAQVPHTH